MERERERRQIVDGWFKPLGDTHAREDGQRQKERKIFTIGPREKSETELSGGGRLLFFFSYFFPPAAAAASNESNRAAAAVAEKSWRADLERGLEENSRDNEKCASSYFVTDIFLIGLITL